MEYIDLGIKITLTGTIFQGLRWSSLSWSEASFVLECVPFEQLRPVQLTLSCTVSLGSVTAKQSYLLGYLHVKHSVTNTPGYYQEYASHMKEAV